MEHVEFGSHRKGTVRRQFGFETTIQIRICASKNWPLPLRVCFWKIESLHERGCSFSQYVFTVNPFSRENRLINKKSEFKKEKTTLQGVRRSEKHNYPFSAFLTW